MGNSEFKRVYTLRQDTPLIHFQHEQAGACLRASEVKPQLDRFLCKMLGGADKMREDREMSKWFLSEQTPALNYKMSIRAIGEPEKSEETEYALNCITACGRTSCNGFNNNQRDYFKCNRRQCPGYRLSPNRSIEKSYFGNMVSIKSGMSPQEKKDAVKTAYKDTIFYKEGLKLTIVCFIKGLQTVIANHITTFFLLHNFGTRSNKGFGSFCVTQSGGIDLQYNLNSEIVRDFEFPVYRVVPISKVNNFALLRYVSDVYKLMKSGVNQQGDYFRAFIYQYMHSQTPPVGNEKAWLKHSDIAPIVSANDSHKHEHIKKPDIIKGNYQYVRAMLGVGDSVTYLNGLNTRDKTKVLISRCEGAKKVERFRFASPLVFKIVDNKLFILVYLVDKEMLGKQFYFSSVLGNGTLSTPKSFDMNDFVEQFSVYINNDCNPKDYDTNRKLSDTHSISFRGKIERCK